MDSSSSCHTQDNMERGGTLPFFSPPFECGGFLFGVRRHAAAFTLRSGPKREQAPEIQSGSKLP